MFLILKDFGKFKNKTFEISERFTLFFGENESGKTTIFDSLMTLFTKDTKKTSSFTKKIKARYGETFECRLEPDINDNIKLHPDAYQNLYAIRQSEILFDIKDNKKDAKEWEQAIKIKLFSSDIDIMKLNGEIKSEYSGTSKTSINPQIASLKTQKNEINDELEEIKKEVSCADKKSNIISQLKEEIKKLKDKKKDFENALLQLKKYIEEIKKSKSKTEKTEILVDIKKFNKLNENINENEIYQKDYIDEITLLTKTIDNHKEKIKEINYKLETIKDKNKENLNIDISSLKKRLENAVQEIDKLNTTSKKTHSSKILHITIVVITAIVTSVLSILFRTPLFLFGLIPSVILLFIKDSSKNKKNENEIIDLVLKNLPEINADKTSIQTIRDSLIKELGKISIDTSKEDALFCEKLENELNEIKIKLDDKEENLKGLFDKLGVNHINEYTKKKNYFNIVYKEAEFLYTKLMNYAKRMTIKDIVTLEVEIMRELKTLDDEYVDIKETSERELQKAENEYSNLIKMLKNIEEEIAENNNKVSRLEGEIFNIATSNNKIVELESEIAQKENEIVNLEKRKRALILLESVFEILNKKTDDVFNNLTNDATALYSHITENISGNEKIKVESFDKDKITVMDKQKENRSIEALSSATRDTVYIAMRMSILKRIHEEGRIILLDDPFITFDEKRLLNALLFLKGFAEEYNIRIILFTKDMYIKNIFADYFKDSIVHTLN